MNFVQLDRPISLVFRASNKNLYLIWYKFLSNQPDKPTCQSVDQDTTWQNKSTDQSYHARVSGGFPSEPLDHKPDFVIRQVMEKYLE